MKSIPVVWRVVLYVVSVVFFSVLLSVLFLPLLTKVLAVSLSGMIYYMVAECCLLLSVVLVSWLMLTYVDRRPFSDLGLTLRGHGKDLVYGMLVAMALYGIGFGVSLALGAVRVTGAHFHPVDLAASWLFFVMVAFAEEIMVRGYIFGRLLTTRMNKYLALLLSSLVFAAGHLFNPGMAFLPMFNLVLAGLLLGASYLYTRNLWFPISLHLFWNWIQGPVLGYEVSGTNLGSTFLTLELSGSDLVSGGAFGFEGSVVCTALMIVFTVGISWFFKTKKSIKVKA